MTDSKTLSLVIPAISLSYAVKQDSESKLIFWNDSNKIYFNNDSKLWTLVDPTGAEYSYYSLKEALIEGSE